MMSRSRHRHRHLPASATIALAALSFLFIGCGDDDDGDHDTEADAYGVGAQCNDDLDCEEENEGDTDAEIELTCLTQFAGGYCGLDDCQGNEDCPDAAACVAHTDGMNYCFRRCLDKSECNANRDPDVESNCSSNIEFVEPTSGKACVPPSSGA